jgi:hypothetical protein
MAARVCQYENENCFHIIAMGPDGLCNFRKILSLESKMLDKPYSKGYDLAIGNFLNLQF